MTDFILLTDAAGGSIRLTTDSPASSYGIPVLSVDASDLCGDFGPADVLGASGIIAACLVRQWGDDEDRTQAEVDAARMFLGQWPEGPQLESENVD